MSTRNYLVLLMELVEDMNECASLLHSKWRNAAIPKSLHILIITLPSCSKYSRIDKGRSDPPSFTGQDSSAVKDERSKPRSRVM